jgi:hypothetical protein
MGERTRYRALHFGHTSHERQHPLRREHVKLESWVPLVKQVQQRLGEDRVADPRGRDDQYFH